MDNYNAIRSLSFPTLAAALGLDITKFKVRKNGQEYYGPCPVHNPKNNSTSFSYLSDGRYFCFSCSTKGKGGLDLTKAVKQIGFKEAVALLEPLVGTCSPECPAKEKSPVLGESVELKPFTGKYERYAVPCPCLEERIPDTAVRERYGVFQYFNPSRRSAFQNRVMIPVKDVQGTLFGYLGRYIPHTDPSAQVQEGLDIPKYLFPARLPKSKFLFGAHELWEGRPYRIVYLVESPFCVMKFASLGLPAVSPFGWSVSETQIQILCQLCKGVLYLPDRNKSDSVADVVQSLAQHLWVRFPPLPAGIDDPEALSLEQVQHL